MFHPTIHFRIEKWCVNDRIWQFCPCNKIVTVCTCLNKTLSATIKNIFTAMKNSSGFERKTNTCVKTSPNFVIHFAEVRVRRKSGFNLVLSIYPIVLCQELLHSPNNSGPRKSSAICSDLLDRTTSLGYRLRRYRTIRVCSPIQELLTILGN